MNRLVAVLRVLILFGIVALYALVLRGWAHAQDHAPGVPAPAHLTPAERAYAFLLGTVSYNEAGSSRPDLALIHQASSSHGETAAEWSFWLSRHSPCAAGRLSQDEANRRPGRCRWTRNLNARGVLPRGWPHSQAAWHRERGRWLEHLRAALAFRTLPIVCPSAPESWDGARWREDVEARGWVVLDCKGTLNLGVVRE